MPHMMLASPAQQIQIAPNGHPLAMQTPVGAQNVVVPGGQVMMNAQGVPVQAQGAPQLLMVNSMTGQFVHQGVPHPQRTGQLGQPIMLSSSQGGMYVQQPGAPQSLASPVQQQQHTKKPVSSSGNKGRKEVEIDDTKGVNSVGESSAFSDEGSVGSGVENSSRSVGGEQRGDSRGGSGPGSPGTGASPKIIAQAAMPQVGDDQPRYFLNQYGVPVQVISGTANSVSPGIAMIPQQPVPVPKPQNQDQPSQQQTSTDQPPEGGGVASESSSSSPDGGTKSPSTPPPLLSNTQSLR